jgi:hypothetical protein
MDDNLDIDMSWIKEYSRIHSLQQIMNREELDSIVIQTIYMNTNMEITKINKEPLKLNTNSHNRPFISKELLLQIIQTKKVIEKTKYKLFDMLLFTVDLDPKDIQKYVNGECSEIAQLKSIPVVDDIVIPPSIFIFHSLHAVFLFFTEIAEKSGKKSDGGSILLQDVKPIKSILKLDNTKLKQTKKVRISENPNLIIPRPAHKKTRKIWHES